MSAVIEAFFLCLLASMIWAPIVFLIVARVSHNASNMADKLWPVALVVTALPAIFAPFAAAAGLSFRQSAPLPPMVAYEAPTNITATIIEPVFVPATSLSISAVLEATATLYFYGFLMFLVLGFVRMIWFSYRVQYAFDIDEPKLEAGLEDWRFRMGIKRRPRYAFSDAISSVCVHGIFRPTILMPMTLLDRVSVEDAILMGAHEMAHIKRGDTALFALCTAARAIFWFNPFIQRIAARANLAAEQAADALVIARGAERRQYAHCFVQGLRFASGVSPMGQELVPSFTPFDKRSRRERLDAILSKKAPAAILTLPHKIGLMLSIVAAVGLAFAQAAFAVAPASAREALPEAPLRGKITMGFGATSILLGDDRPTHEGIDIKAVRGTPVLAAGDGKVIDATSRYRGQRAWGNVVVVDHGHGLVTRYAHLDKFTVKKGDTVNAGDPIGAAGSTGKSTGPHLHFEVIQDGQAIDPAPVLAATPMAPPAPVIRPDPVRMPDQVISIVPAPTIVGLSSPEPGALPAPSATPATVSTRIEQELAGRFKFIEKHMTDAFEGFEIDFNDFDDFEFEFDSTSFERLNGIQSWAWLSKEERKDIEKAKHNAMEIAREAMSQAKVSITRAQRDIERAQRNAERDNERAQRDRQRARRDAERKRERIARDFERSIERAEVHAEKRAEARTEKMEYQWEQTERYNHNVSEHELLNLRQKALEEAQDDLERELKEVKRQREKLERKKRKAKNN